MEPDTDDVAENVYLFTVMDGYHYIYTQPSFESVCVQRLPAGIYTIVEEKYDQYRNLLGKIKSGAGWICLTDIVPS